MDRMMEMEAFANVVDHGGFTDAARKMGISKSAVSKHVANLEVRLGARLLNRTTRRVSPTEIGLVYYDRARQVLNDAGEADALVSSMQREPAGLLRVSVATDFGVKHLTPILGEFMEDFPNIKLDVVLNNRFVELISEGFDMAVRIGDMQDSTLRTRKLAETERRIVASPAYLQRMGVPETLDALTDHMLLHFTSKSVGNVWKFPTASGECKLIRSETRLAVNDGQSLLNAAISGVGLAYLPAYLYADAMREGLIVDAMPGLPQMRQGIHAVYPPGRFLQPKVRAFVDFLAHQLSDKGPREW
ncbi:MAG: LysR family transcriptional regulator [Rhodobacteraceae bacterium]|nr:LysR family transcriptional regulator [Paracoccaceae bacterium]